MGRGSHWENITGLQTKQSCVQIKQQERVIVFCAIWRNIFDTWMILFFDSFGSVTKICEGNMTKKWNMKEYWWDLAAQYMKTK